jgi:tetratricopeptide (TPR) repeat protein
MLSDTVSLVSLFAITAALALATNAFHRSYATHQAVLARRWEDRGKQDLAKGDPVAAINALRSALIYAPGQRDIEIQLAGALASAGRFQEATSYFNTLAEAEPGSGIINLQLARLAARQASTSQAIDYYHRAIYGNWEGDGYIRRRDVRIELINYLISRQLYTDARSELLVAAGNSPNTDIPFLLEIGDAMERAFDPGDALHVYRTILQHEPASFTALQGAGRTAFDLGHFVEAKQYLEKALISPAAKAAPPAALQPIQDQLRDTTRLLMLYPSPQLGLGAQTQRILTDREIAHARLQSCLSSAAAGQSSATPGSTIEQTPNKAHAGESSPNQASGTPNAGSPATSEPANAKPKNAGQSGSGSASSLIPGTSTIRGSIENFASRFRRTPKPATDEATSSPPSVSLLDALSARWTEQPDQLTASMLESNVNLTQSTIQLIYDTEKITQQVCGEPTGDDALLLKIAEAPNVVGQE